MIALALALALAGQAAAAPWELVAESADGGFSATPFESERACERARKAAQRRIDKRERRTRRALAGKPFETRWMILPACRPR